MYDYERFIKRCVLNGQKVPARVLKKYFSFFEAPLKGSLVARKDSLLQIRKEIIAIYGDHHSFAFKFTVKSSYVHPLTERVDFFDSEYSLDGFIEHLFHFLAEDYLCSLSEKKETLIPYVYSHLRDYMSYADRPDYLTEYKMLAITGLVTAGFGFLMSEHQFKTRRDKSKKQYYPEYLQDSVKYMISKAKNSA